ncbi:hypothetical protein PHACT_12550 [Pseudohongiella acticola]|uniref:DUF3168 domain-containing protein n=1 Tax=Pseudohongiella acticola TaxID=1524254 RepID=A0A1E8CFY6_9GAMM|nr:DUF3168 domain-containing protein [Pseudohongiella acticola]OFE11381.1 hypothetical protein PHACT_12550 [Pseudohongiella acticola]
MFAPVFATLSASAEVAQLLGSGADMRLYPIEADQGTPVPYAVITQIGGPTENQLSGGSATDRYLIQIDSYAKTLTEARAVAGALRAAVQDFADVDSVGRESRSAKTRHYSYQFDIEWLIAN